MGTSSKIDSTFFRLGEVCSAVIVVLLLSHFYINASDDGRLIYTEIISVLEPVFSILLPISTNIWAPGRPQHLLYLDLVHWGRFWEALRIT
ncbi:hypothetical protein PMIN05_011354 [Paraphaeosphaeria minitans]